VLEAAGRSPWLVPAQHKAKDLPSLSSIALEGNTSPPNRNDDGNSHYPQFTLPKFQHTLTKFPPVYWTVLRLVLCLTWSYPEALRRRDVPWRHLRSVADSRGWQMMPRSGTGFRLCTLLDSLPSFVSDWLTSRPLADFSTRGLAELFAKATHFSNAGLVPTLDVQPLSSSRTLR
jgi:hypothetical protein